MRARYSVRMSIHLHAVELPAPEVVELQGLGIEYLIRAAALAQLRAGTRPSVRSISGVLRQRYGRSASDSTITPVLAEVYRQISVVLTQPSGQLPAATPPEIVEPAVFFLEEMWARALDVARRQTAGRAAAKPGEAPGGEAEQAMSARLIALEMQLAHSERRRLAAALRLQRARRFHRKGNCHE